MTPGSALQEPTCRDSVANVRKQGPVESCPQLRIRGSARRRRADSLAGVERDLRLFAQSQGGAFTAKQALELMPRASLSKLVHTGSVIRESRLVFRWADAPDGIPARIRRAELQVGTTLVACGRSAAGLYGFGVLTDERLHVTTASARSMVAPASVVIHQQILRSAPMQCHGCWATDPGDTAVDVATSCPRIDVWPVLDAALRAGLPSSDLRAAIDRAARRRGIAFVRDQVAYADGRAESPMESRTRFRVHEAGLPPPDLQVLVELPDGRFRLIDLGWREARVGLEFDGQDFHAGDGSLDRDRRRASDLLAAGWLIVHVTGRDVYTEPGRFTDLLRRLLSQRGA